MIPRINPNGDSYRDKATKEVVDCIDDVIRRFDEEKSKEEREIKHAFFISYLDGVLIECGVVPWTICIEFFVKMKRLAIHSENPKGAEILDECADDVSEKIGKCKWGTEWVVVEVDLADGDVCVSLI